MALLASRRITWDLIICTALNSVLRREWTHSAKKRKKKVENSKGFFLRLLYLMQSALAKCTALLHVKAVLSFFFLPALELLQRDKVLQSSLTHTVVISQSRLAPCPTKHKLPWSLQLFHGNTTVINTANNCSNPFYVSPLSTGKDSIAPSPGTCANYWAWKETVMEIALPSAWSCRWDQRKEKALKHLTLLSVLLLEQKDCCCVYKMWNAKKCKHIETEWGCKQQDKAKVQCWVEFLSPRECRIAPRCLTARSLPGYWCAGAGFQGITADRWFCKQDCSPAQCCE